MDMSHGTNRAALCTARFSARVQGIAATAAVLVLCLGGTYAFWRHVMADAERVRTSEFHERVGEAVHHVAARLDRHRQLVRSLAALYAAAPGVSQDSVNTYLDNLQLPIRSPELRAAGIHMPTRDAPRPLIQASRLLPAAGAAHAPWAAQTSMSAKIPDGREDTGASGNVALFRLLPGDVPQDATSAGTWVFAQISVERMMRQLIADDLSHVARDIDIAIYDGSTASAAGLMYGAHSTAPGAYGLTELRRLEFGGREWTLVVRALPGFKAAR